MKERYDVVVIGAGPAGLLAARAIAENGFDVGLLLSEAISTRIGIFAWADVLISATVLIGFIIAEGGRQKMRWLWLPILGTCTVGVSIGLPLFLLQRELHIERNL